MTKTQAWLRAFRFRTLPLSVSGIIAGSGIALHDGFWNWYIFMLSLSTTVLFQIVSNLANDLGDSMKGTDNEHRVGPVRSVQSGLISMQAMKIAVGIFSLLSLFSALLLIFYAARNLDQQLIYFYILLAILCVIAAITYTVGKKAYGYRGLGDLMVFIFFGLVSVLGVYPLFANHLPIDILLPASSIGCLSVAVLNLNNLRDRENDERSNKRTLVVVLGEKKSKVYHVLLIVIGLISMATYLVIHSEYYSLLALIPSGVILTMHLDKVLKNKDPKLLDPELKKVAMSTFLLSVLVFVALNI